MSNSNSKKNTTCLFCEQTSIFQPPSKVPSLGSKFKDYKVITGDIHDVDTSQKIYLEKYCQYILEGAIKIPEAKFFSQGQSHMCPEPDLVIDEELDAHKNTVRRRQTAQDEENVARRFLLWSLNKGKAPSLTLSGNAFSNYLKDVSF